MTPGDDNGRGDFTCFDRIVCITLAGNTARREHAQRELTRCGAGAFRFFVAQRHARGGRVGCFDSHVRVVRAAYGDPSCHTLLVFEDDVKLASTFQPAVLRQVESFVKRDDTWEALMLGFFPLQPDQGTWRLGQGVLSFITSDPVAPNIYRHGHALLTHAYALSRRGMQRILQAASEQLAKPTDLVPHYDEFLCGTIGICQHMYCVVPQLFDQAWCMGTDNVSASAIEAFARRFSCAAESTEIVTHLTKARQHRVIVALAVSALLVALAFCVASLWRRARRLT
jgi:GR25 family glycosyltransferase involved in LPS biosynthesis